MEELASLVAGLGALDVFVLPPQAGAQLIAGREQAFWNAKAAGADDIIDMVVPRASMPAYMSQVAELARDSGSWVAGCGHAGDGNVHLSVFQPDAGRRERLDPGPASPPAWRWAVPSPVSMASVSEKRSTSRPSRTPSSSACGAASRRPSTRRTSSTRERFSTSKPIGGLRSRGNETRPGCLVDVLDVRVEVAGVAGGQAPLPPPPRCRAPRPRTRIRPPSRSPPRRTGCRR